MMVLIVDGTFLAHRAQHTTGKLSFDGAPTGIAYGVLQSVSSIEETFCIDKTVWAFDGDDNLRKKVYPEYKANRRKEEWTEDEELKYIQFRREVDRLIDEILPGLGYSNVFRVKGYEADDIIARAAINMVEEEDNVIIVSSDTDLWQLLDTKTHCYNPITKKYLIASTFIEEQGIRPSMWAEVKAIAGCNSDNIKGVKGVGSKTAIAYLQGELSENHKKYKDIESEEGKRIYKRNLPLVKLPWPGLLLPELRADEKSMKRQRKIQEMLGFREKRGKRKDEKKSKKHLGFCLD